LIPNYPQDDYILCALLVLAGDTEGYRKCRTKMFRKFADLNDPDVDWRLARAYVIAPGGGADPAIGLPLIERAVRSNPNGAWYLHVLGLAQYRAGHFAETIKQLNHSIEVDRVWTDLTAVNWIVLAMAHHQLGHADEANVYHKKVTDYLKVVRHPQYRFPMPP